MMENILNMFSPFFQIGPVPNNQIFGTYDIGIVILSYIVASAASFTALDITGRLRDVGNTKLSTNLWLLGGSFAMGAGIWSMHFIGMLAFQMAMPMHYNIFYTALSLVVAILASGFALALLKTRKVKVFHLALGGVILGCAISTMHYLGMAAMDINMTIHYLPGLFFTSIIIGILASEAALYLAIKSTRGSVKYRTRLKILSAFVMGAAICGMHYTGMAAAIFTHNDAYMLHSDSIAPNLLATVIAIITFFILGIAFNISSYKEFLNNHQVKLARQAGMAEVASNVLHNVGNVLNSVNVSAELVHDYISNTKLVGLKKVCELLDTHESDLASYLTTDPRGSQIPQYLHALATVWQKEQSEILNEMKLQRKNIQHIKDVISLQQSLTGISSLKETIELDELIDESLQLTSINFKQHNIKVEKNYEKIKPIVIDKSKFQQILINLIRNATDALKEAEGSEQKMLKILTSKSNDNIIIKISDNGIGITPKNMSLIFSHGFSTKQDGHGFGLHASAIAANELDGTLKAESEGLGKGASFILEIPYTVNIM